MWPIESVNDEAQPRIDWNKVWSKKYPVLAAYHKTVRINDYAPASREMLTQLRADYIIVFALLALRYLRRRDAAAK